jgi:hypothetical protein
MDGEFWIPRSTTLSLTVVVMPQNKLGPLLHISWR